MESNANRRSIHVRFEFNACLIHARFPRFRSIMEIIFALNFVSRTFFKYSTLQSLFQYCTFIVYKLYISTAKNNLFSFFSRSTDHFLLWLSTYGNGTVCNGVCVLRTCVILLLCSASPFLQKTTTPGEISSKSPVWK